MPLNPINGTPGDDSLEGTEGDDLIQGGDGSDYLSGNGGDDTLEGGSGVDGLVAGEGTDTLYGGDDGDGLDGEGGNDTLYGEDGDDSLYGGSGDDTLEGGNGDDELSGEDGADILRGGDGNDTFREVGVWGFDTVDAGAGDDKVYLSGWNTGAMVTLGAGVDTVYLGYTDGGTAGVTVTDFVAGTGGDKIDFEWLLSEFSLNGWDGDANPFSVGYVHLFDDGNGNTLLQVDEDGEGDNHEWVTALKLQGVTVASLTADNVGPYPPDGSAPVGRTIVGTPGDDELAGTYGDDLIRGGDGTDYIDGKKGNDTLEGGSSRDHVDGGDGTDTLYGDNGGDLLYGEEGNDTLYGGEGDDFLYGGDGLDTLSGGNGDDSLFGGTGLDARDGADTMDGGAGDDNFYGSDGGDIQRGGDGNDIFYDVGNIDPSFAGHVGSDTVDAGSGNDKVYLETWNAKATVTLGAGVDTVYVAYWWGSGAGADVRVTDFVAGAGGDRIDVGGLDEFFLNGWDGDTNPFSAGYLRLVNDGSGNALLQIDRDGAGGNYGWANALKLQGVTAASLTTHNIGPYLPPNTPPTAASPIADQVSMEDQAWSYVLPANTFTDPEGSPLTLSAALADGSALPSWLSFNAATRTFAGTPPANFNGALDIRVTASDGALAAADTFRLTVGAVNDAPVAHGIANQAAAEGQPFAFTVPAGAFSDVDGSAPTLSATLSDGSALPAWLTFDAATGTFAGTPQDGNAGMLGLRVTATDPSSASVATTFVVTVADTLGPITGGGGNDKLNGGNGGDVIDGGGGNDALSGGGGSDRLVGGTGNDKLMGGSGADDLTGGKGKDIFAFGSLADIGKKRGQCDTIFDFDNGDRIDLKAIDANTKKGGGQAFHFDGERLGQIDTAIKKGMTLVTGDVNGDGKADFLLELAGKHTLDAGDFLL